MHCRMFWCLDQGDSIVQVGGLTYLPLWENVTDYLQGIKLRNNLHSSSFLLLQLWKILHKNCRPLVLAKSPYFHGSWYFYLSIIHCTFHLHNGWVYVDTTNLQPFMKGVTVYTRLQIRSCAPWTWLPFFKAPCNYWTRHFMISSCSNRVKLAMVPLLEYSYYTFRSDWARLCHNFKFHIMFRRVHPITW